MDDYTKHLTIWTRDMVKTVMEKSIALGQQITTWLVVGNAGAMVLSFNAVIQGSPCRITVTVATIPNPSAGHGSPEFGDYWNGHRYPA